jgi:hypothetical protein
MLQITSKARKNFAVKDIKIDLRHNMGNQMVKTCNNKKANKILTKDLNPTLYFTKTRKFWFRHTNPLNHYIIKSRHKVTQIRMKTVMESRVFSLVKDSSVKMLTSTTLSKHQLNSNLHK